MRKIRLQTHHHGQTIAELIRSPGYKLLEQYMLRTVDKILNEGVKFKRPEDWAKYEGARMIAQLAHRIASAGQVEERDQEPPED